MSTASDRRERRIEDSVVTVSTPNERVFAEVRGERHVKVWFAAGHYDGVSSSRLEQELATVARLLFAAGLREHERVNRETASGVGQYERRIALGRRDKEYAEALATLAAEGRSEDGSVTVSAVGQQGYAVTIAPGTLDRLDEQSFRWHCTQAAEALLAETEQKAALARVRIYQPLPGVTV